jgi:hypothetical protein
MGQRNSYNSTDVKAGETDSFSDKNERIYTPFPITDGLWFLLILIPLLFGPNNQKEHMKYNTSVSLTCMP